MNQLLIDLKPEPNDLVVVPEDFVIPAEGVPFLIHKIKFLLKPSIIRSGFNNMNFFESLSTGMLLEWLTGKTASPESESTSQKPLQIVMENLQAGLDAQKSKEKLPTFYRYVRPLDEKNDFNLGPKGGVTFYIELDAPNKTLAFAYSLCHYNDLFNRKIARHISKQRFEHDDWYEIAYYDPDLSVTTNIKNAIQLLLSGKDSDNIAVTKFSSISERLNKYELNLIFERI